MRCEKCGGLIIKEKIFAENQMIEITHCLHCAEYECPPENRELKQINLLAYRAKEKTKHIGYSVYGIERKRG